MKVMKIYNHELKPFIEFLYKLKLIDKKSRMRSRFIKLLAEKKALFDEEHMQLLKEHCRLDENGNPKVIKIDDTRSQYDVIDYNAFAIAFSELRNEEVIIEQNEERKEMLLSVKDSVLNCGLEFEGDDAILYSRFCDIVEQLNYD